MKIYDVSRMTVRQAIGELVDEGILQKKQGLGTFVLEKTLEHPTTKLYGMVEELILTGHDISIELIRSGTESPDGETARALELEPNETVYFYYRIAKDEELPLLLTKASVHSRIRHLFTAIDGNMTHDVIYEQLERCGYQVSHAVQTITAGTPTRAEAEYLNCKKTTPVLIVHRLTHLKGGSPVVYSRHVYRPNHGIRLNLER